MPSPRVLLSMLFAPLALACGGCFTGATAAYAFGDPAIRNTWDGEVDQTAFTVIPASRNRRPRLVTEVATSDGDDFLVPYLGRRYVTVALGDDYAPPAALAVADVEGMTPGQVDDWLEALAPAERAELADRALAARGRLTPARGSDRGRYEPITRLPIAELAAVASIDARGYALGDDIVLVAYRRPPTPEAETTRAASQPSGPEWFRQRLSAPFDYALVLPRRYDPPDRLGRVVGGTLLLPVAVVGDVSGAVATGALAIPAILATPAVASYVVLGAVAGQ